MFELPCGIFGLNLPFILYPFDQIVGEYLKVDKVVRIPNLKEGDETQSQLPNRHHL